MESLLPDTLLPLAAAALVLGVFAAFLVLRARPEVIALCGAALALALGLASTQDILDALSNPAPATIGAMFILSAALVRTGALEGAVAALERIAGPRPRTTVLVFFAGAAAASAVMNNTPVMVVLIPVAAGLAQGAGIAPSRLLIPLSYMVILGGTCSMIGTSTNLLVDGIGRKAGMAPFGLFEIAPLGVLVALVGGLFLALAGPRLLPERTVSAPVVARESRSWIAQLFVPAGSAVIGRRAVEIPALSGARAALLDVIRGDVSLRHDLAGVTLEAGDRIVLRTRDVELMGFREGTAKGLTIPGLEPAEAARSTVVEVLVGPGSRVLGRPLRRLRLRRRFGAYAIALHRDGAQVAGSPEDVALEVGDLLLMDGTQENLSRLVDEMRLIPLTPLRVRAVRPHKAPIALAVLAGVVLLASLGVAPILTLAIIGVAVVLATGCIDADEGLSALDGGLLVLIVAMLIIGAALENSGALILLAEWLAPAIGTLGPLAALALVYAATSILTELVTNNAVAVLMVPLATGIAAQAGLDPRPFAVAVMFGASASFATPIGYQTNTMVYTAGGYRFRDFLRVGVPMNLVVGAVTVLAIPFFWPLVPQ